MIEPLHDSSDREIDSLLAAMARVDAPDDFANRLSVALDLVETRPGWLAEARPGWSERAFGRATAAPGRDRSLVPALRLAAVAAGALALGIALWNVSQPRSNESVPLPAAMTASRATATSATATSATASGATASGAMSGGTQSRPTPPITPGPAARPPVVVSGTAARHHVGGRQRTTDDHEMALAALPPVSPVRQRAIAPLAIDPETLDVAPILAIAPLDAESGRRTGGQGDFR